MKKFFWVSTECNERESSCSHETSLGILSDAEIAEVLQEPKVNLFVKKVPMGKMTVGDMACHFSGQLGGNIIKGVYYDK